MKSASPIIEPGCARHTGNETERASRNGREKAYSEKLSHNVAKAHALRVWNRKENGRKQARESRRRQRRHHPSGKNDLEGIALSVRSRTQATLPSPNYLPA